MRTLPCSALSLRSIRFPSPLSARVTFSTTAACASTKKRRTVLVPDSPARTRFAPSPTGLLHLGSLRTALFNYLLARRTGGQFILRIEDTDQKRTIAGAEQHLYEDLQWAGLEWDEGPGRGSYGPYRQSERTSLYKQEIGHLIHKGHAYRCFCSPERLDELARHRDALGLAPVYDGACSHISPQESSERAHNHEPHVVRLRAPRDYPMFNDLIFGRTGHNAGRGGKLASATSSLGDPILVKSDGHPTYHFANVVDDHHMNITHVIRGTEWMSSTPLHMSLYQAFNWDAPKFAHVPLLCDTTGAKLSKRNHDINITAYREKEIFPEALINFCALLGWSHDKASDVFSLKELEHAFDLKLTKGNTTVSFEKLWYMQKVHAQRRVAAGGDGLHEMISQISSKVFSKFPPEQVNSILGERSLTDYLRLILHEGARSYTTSDAFLDSSFYFFTNDLNRPPFIKKVSQDTNTNPGQDSEPKNPPTPLSKLHAASAALCFIPESHWTTATHKANIDAIIGFAAGGADTDASKIPDASQQKLFKRELYHYLRWALSGGASGVGIPAIMAILGRDVCVKRIQEARELSANEAAREGKSFATQNASSCCGPRICQSGKDCSSKA